MEAVFAIVGLIIFVIFLVRFDQRRIEKKARKKYDRSFRPVDADERVIALLIEHQAKLDMTCFAVRAMLDSHPRRAELQSLILGYAPVLVEAYTGITESPGHKYQEAVQNALRMLVRE
ncbi:hypothetical protein [Burkholderia glumae]